MKQLNQIIIGILTMNLAEVTQLESLTKTCSPLRMVALNMIDAEVKIAESIFMAMQPLAEGRDLQVINAFRSIILGRYNQITKNIAKYEKKTCPHNSLEGYLFYIREGIEKNLEEHKKMDKLFRG